MQDRNHPPHPPPKKKKEKNTTLNHTDWRRFPNYENTPIQIYRTFHLQKTETFQIKNFDIFHISVQNIDCGVLVKSASARRISRVPTIYELYTPVNLVLLY